MKHKNAVLEGLYRMLADTSEESHKVTISQMISEVENETLAGKKFLADVYDAILSYLMKFETI